MANIVYMAKSAWTGLLDSIRSKAGTAGSMTVSQATDAVDSIQTGGGGGDEFKSLVERTISETVSGNVSYIGSYAFAYCQSLTSVSFPTATSILANAFLSCNKLTDIYMPNLKTISSYAFAYCSSLRSLSFPLVTRIYSSAFGSCNNLTEANFSAVTSIYDNAFYGCVKLTSVSIPEAETIGSSAFYSCRSIETLSLPNVSSIAGNAFGRCFTLLSLYLLGSSIPTLVSTAFVSTPISNYTTSTGGVNGSIFVPASLYSNYLTATNWSLYSARIVSVSE